jgi:CHAD domain-containing protein
MLVREWSEPLRAELDWLGDVLGPARDLDVLIEHVRKEAEDLPPEDRRALARAVVTLEAEREAARAAVLEALTSERYLELLSAVERAARAPHVVSLDTSLHDLAAREFRRLRRAARDLRPEPGDDELHRLRIKGKRARYAAELAEDAVGKPAARFVERAKRFQDVIGDHQDAAVADQRLRELRGSVRGASAAFVLGRLVERQQVRRLRARAQVPRTWKKLERSGRKAWS